MIYSKLAMEETLDWFSTQEPFQPIDDEYFVEIPVERTDMWLALVQQSIASGNNLAIINLLQAMAAKMDVIEDIA
eukprot:4003868-Prymnesium_polylepis.1